MTEKSSDINRIILFDSHCHPQFPHYNQDRDEMIKRTLKEGVFMICVGTDLETSKKGIELAGKYEGIWTSVGLHPNEKENFNSEVFKKLLSSERVIGFGEIGLDYYRTEKKEDQKIQKQRFEEQLELAAEIGKPLVIHCRNAHSDMIQILENCKLKIENSGRHWRAGVIHSFTGTLEEAKKYLDSGFYLGFNGIITFANQYDEIVKYTPLENILLETDAPYLTPLPFRGKRNEPAYVKYIAEKIAELKGLSYSQVAEKTSENTKKLFNL